MQKFCTDFFDDSLNILQEEDLDSSQSGQYNIGWKDLGSKNTVQEEDGRPKEERWNNALAKILKEEVYIMVGKG